METLVGVYIIVSVVVIAGIFAWGIFDDWSDITPAVLTWFLINTLVVGIGAGVALITGTP